MSTKNYRLTNVAELLSDISNLEAAELPSTEWAQRAQETDLDNARLVLATLTNGGWALRGMDDDGLWFLSSEESREDLATQLLMNEMMGDSDEIRALDPDDYPAHCCERFNRAEGLLVAAGFEPGAEVFLDDPRPGDIYVKAL